MGATHYLDFWQRAQQRRQQQPLGPAAGPAAGSGGLQADVWGLQTYRPALLLEVSRRKLASAQRSAPMMTGCARVRMYGTAVSGHTCKPDGSYLSHVRHAHALSPGRPAT